ncbi:uncharacterized protein LOC132739567 isoform X2 [Ruditapes philippinarum]|uniref:uncharacterized protein LOC132739567 isoform X2 n=1 Tax=Ruditapes philippinarum TaxID=129788 RepID=UPI00295A9BCC|nr:uncharacterized protein LOC132739567 isoform X2 [Ruditapes philippinarum]
MADLTDEQKIIIGVCCGVAGLILIAIVVFICCIFLVRGKRRRRNGYKDDLIVDRYDNRYDKYPVYEKEVPAVIYDPPPPPPMWREPVYHKRPVDIPYKYDTWDRFSEPPRKYSDRYMGGYRNEPIIVPMAEPEYVSSRAPRREPDTIYLNRPRRKRYVTDNTQNVRQNVRTDQHVMTDVVTTAQSGQSGQIDQLLQTDRPLQSVQQTSRYVDDQALLSRSNNMRRSEYYGGGGGAAGMRRSRSFHDVRGGSAYVGEWRRNPEIPSQFNERALKMGHDPFLWS